MIVSVLVLGLVLIAAGGWFRLDYLRRMHIRNPSGLLAQWLICLGAMCLILSVVHKGGWIG